MLKRDDQERPCMRGRLGVDEYKGEKSSIETLGKMRPGTGGSGSIFSTKVTSTEHIQVCHNTSK